MAIRSGDHVIDVGAHNEFYSVLFGLAVGADSRVVSAEPHPDNAAILRTNLKDNRHEQRVRVEEVAARSADGAARSSSISMGLHAGELAVALNLAD